MWSHNYVIWKNFQMKKLIHTIISETFMNQSNQNRGQWFARAFHSNIPTCAQFQEWQEYRERKEHSSCSWRCHAPLEIWKTLSK